MNGLTEKQKRMNRRLWASEELLKRYIPVIKPKEYKRGNKTYYYNPLLNWGKERQRKQMDECVDILSTVNTPIGAKKAAKIILKYIVGKQKANDLIESIAIVEDRDDPLVNRWRKKVIERDNKCVECDSVEELHAHHISHWADDPVNRINVNNGVTLCRVCHSKEHPELEGLINSRVVY